MAYCKRPPLCFYLACVEPVCCQNISRRSTSGLHMFVCIAIFSFGQKKHPSIPNSSNDVSKWEMFFPGTILEPEMLIVVSGFCSTILFWGGGTQALQFWEGWMYYQNRVAGTKRSRCPSRRSTSNRHGVVKARSRKDDTWNSLVLSWWQAVFGKICHVIDRDLLQLVM